MSLLLNGGGVAQLKVIETELNNAMSGNQAEIKDLIEQLDTFVGGLEEQKSEIVRAIDNIDTLAARLETQKEDLGRAIDAMPGGLKVLADQRTQLVQMLSALSRLGDVGTEVIQPEQGRHRGQPRGARSPILGELTKAGDDLPKSMQLLLTYPFVGRDTAAMRGDYTNMSADLDLNLENLAGSLGLPDHPTHGRPPTGPATGRPAVRCPPCRPCPACPIAGRTARLPAGVPPPASAARRRAPSRSSAHGGGS